MKLCAAQNHVHYHLVVHFCRGVKLDGVLLSNVVYADTEAGEAQVITQPVQLEEDGETLKSHVVKGKVEFVWAERSTLFDQLFKDWQETQMLHKQEQHAI